MSDAIVDDRSTGISVLKGQGPRALSLSSVVQCSLGTIEYHLVLVILGYTKMLY